MSEVRRANNLETLDLSYLDDSQAEVVASSANNVLIRAAAGSGKTRTLMAAIAKHRYDHLNDRICAITYTRAARAEMEARLKEMGIYDIEVTTIHVWARNLLNDFAWKYDFKVSILEEAQIKDILRKLVKEYLLRAPKIRSINLEILYSFITGNKTMDISSNYKRTLVALESRYIKYKRENQLYDFTDYPLYLYHVMLAYNEYVNNIDALFVDEFQDVDETQFKIFERVIAQKKLFIGDGWQSIFVFRGADGAVFEKLDFFEQHKLKYNYRSYQEIINYACEVYLKYKDRLDDSQYYISRIAYDELIPTSKIICARGTGGLVTIVSPWGDFSSSADADEDGIYSGLKLSETFKDFMDRKPMILCRTNKQVKAINEKGYYNVSTVHQAKGLEYDNVIVIDFPIKELEDLNIAYVALTRARNGLYVINWALFEELMNA